MTFSGLEEGLKNTTKEVDANLDKIRDKIKLLEGVNVKTANGTSSDPFNILKTATLTATTPTVNKLIIENLKNNLKQTFQEYNDLFDSNTLTSNFN